jgi:type II secretory pathway pseudopilin PulG
MLELLLVLIIIGVIGALAVPRMSNAHQRSRYTATWSQYGRFEAALNLYLSVWKGYPPDEFNTVPPVGMSSFLRPVAWTRSTPIGGQWDWNNRFNSSGAPVSHWVTFGPNISITQNPAPAALLANFNELDRLVDDSAQTTGKLRRMHTRYLCMPLEPE